MREDEGLRKYERVRKDKRLRKYEGVRKYERVSKDKRIRRRQTEIEREKKKEKREREREIDRWIDREREREKETRMKVVKTDPRHQELVSRCPSDYRKRRWSPAADFPGTFRI